MAVVAPLPACASRLYVSSQAGWRRRRIASGPVRLLGLRCGMEHLPRDWQCVIAASGAQPDAPGQQQRWPPASGPAARPFAGQAGAATPAGPASHAGPLAAAVPDAAAVPPGPQQQEQQLGEEKARRPDAGTLWGLLVLSLAYLHHSTSGFALPALLPIITEDLHLSDNQGALLTAGYTVLYALTLVPIGLLADRVDRPRLLSGGIALWSMLTLAASNARGFGTLLATRIGFAAAQATQNPICFNLIPELFPNHRTTAMAVYNSAIYAGRALSFAALLLAGQLGVPEDLIGSIGGLGHTLVPLDKLDLTLVSVLYTQGDFAAVTPVFDYAGIAGDGVPIPSAFSAWRQLLSWLAPPGLLMAALCLLTVDEPRHTESGDAFVGPSRLSSRFLAGLNARLGGVRHLLVSPGFQGLTLAAALNDVGSWALVSWQATFYQRVYELQPDTYAPLLAVVIPVGGLIGGVGAGLFGDWLFRIGARGWITAGANIAAAPLIAASLLVPDYKESFAALLVGFALSEAWRAPAAVMVRDVSPPGLGATASAVHLCIRNLIGGLGPIAVALLSAKVGLQLAMLLIPTCYAISGLGFMVTEPILKAEAERNAALPVP
eukprot:scaffold8.g1478.t1